MTRWQDFKSGLYQFVGLTLAAWAMGLLHAGNERQGYVMAKAVKEICRLQEAEIPPEVLAEYRKRYRNRHPQKSDQVWDSPSGTFRSRKP